MRRLALYIYDLILLNYGAYLGYRLRQVIEWFELMTKEFDEAVLKENNLFD